MRSELAALRAEADRLRAVPVAAVLTAALLLTTLLWAFLQHAEPFLGHDESVYAGRARSLVTGSPAVGWMAYRPVGLPFIGALGLRLGEDTPSLRRVALLLALVTVLVVHAVAARVTTGRRAAVAVLVMVSGATFIRRVPEFLDDIPAAGLLLLTAYLVLRSRRQGGWWALPAAAATGVAAVLIRYGAAAGLITIALAGIAAWGPRVWLRAWRELLAAGTVLATGLAPLALYSIRETGSPIGLLARAEVTAHRAFLGEGLVYYLRAFPAKLAGVVGALVMAAALIGLAADTRRLLRARRDRLTTGHATTGRPTRAGTVAGRDPARERVFLGLAAVGELVLLGLLAHGEGRFALFTVMTLVVLGVDVVARWSGRWRATALAATAVAAVAATGITSVLVYAQMSQSTGNVTAVAGVAA
ncbi:MAG TPA: glycosyltransferase family 39 protein, partial [Kineosporiaceae bacterium]|nr:glycosyltransferase family 39 protein [Kineosporiaceae bacterium]